MPVKIRLTRQGRKKRPYYHIVVADSRAPRDGRFIEKLGKYDPNTNPATIELNFEKSLDWVQKGAQPTDTCRAILSYKGVMYKKHLLDGVKKNAFSAEEAEERYKKWIGEKESKIQAKLDSVLSSKGELSKKRLEAEKKVNEKRAEEISKKLAKLAEQEAENKKAEGSDSAEEAAENQLSESSSVNTDETGSTEN